MAKKLGVIVIAGLLVALVVIVAIPQLRWRAHVVALHATGQIPGIDTEELVSFIMPGSDQALARLASTRNPYAAIRNNMTSAADVQAGAKLFRDNCAGCHAPDGGGTPAAPPLVGREFKHGESDWAVYRTIKLGVPNTAMMPHALSQTQLWQLVAYLRVIDSEGSSKVAKQESASAQRFKNVDYEELRDLQVTTDDWLTYSGTFNSLRHSGLTQIDRSNVSSLALRWMYQFAGDPIKVEASPIVRNGLMYVTAPPGLVVALDAATGEVVWTYDREPNSSAVSEAGVIANRGVAIMGDKIFVGTRDCHLIALSAKSGELVWDAEVMADKRYFITAAPLVYKDLVVTGMGTTEGGQGFIAAYDANTGKERWRFVTIPQPGEFGNDTWSGDSWKEGGAPTWLTGSYDAEADLVIWGIGNPKPDYDAASRKGDNLYSNSVVALRGTTGELVWHFQFTPNDSHDWDSNQIPILMDYPSAEGTQKRVLFANRNGFYYVLDRESGKFIGAAPFVQQTWTDGLDANGRPKPRSLPPDRQEGFMLYPGNVGGTNWWSPAMNPKLNLFFVPALEQGMVFFNTGDDWPTPSNKPFYTAIRALDAGSGKLIWEHRSQPRQSRNEMGGLLSTETGLVFGADLGTFFGLDAADGKVLWSVETGGRIGSAPITYTVNGEQLVAISGGRALLAFGLPSKGELSMTTKVSR